MVKVAFVVEEVSVRYDRPATLRQFEDDRRGDEPFGPGGRGRQRVKLEVSAHVLGQVTQADCEALAGATFTLDVDAEATLAARAPAEGAPNAG